MYYGLVFAAVLFFSVQFLFNQRYQNECGSGVTATLVFTFGYSVVGLLVLFVVSGFKIEFTPFTLLVASLTAINGIGCSFCSLKSLGKINLSLYSMISMLGGMLLPFFAGILFFNEDLGLNKILCLIIITVALMLTVEKGDGKGYRRYYAGIFVLNGMSGVYSKIFASLEFPKTNDISYSFFVALITAAISAVLLVLLRRPLPKLSKNALVAVSGVGVLNTVANFFLLIALSHIAASAQYPIVTGGVIIFATVISCLTHQKPKKKEIVAVALSFAGILMLAIH